MIISLKNARISLRPSSIDVVTMRLIGPNLVINIDNGKHVLHFDAESEEDLRMGAALFSLLDRCISTGSFPEKAITSEFLHAECKPDIIQEVVAPLLVRSNLATMSASNIITELVAFIPVGTTDAILNRKSMNLALSLIPILVALRDKNILMPMTDMSDITGFSYQPEGIGRLDNSKAFQPYLTPMGCVSLVYPIKKEFVHSMVSEKKQSKQASTSPVPTFIEENENIARLVDKELVLALKSSLQSLGYIPGTSPANQQAFLDQFSHAAGFFSEALCTIALKERLFSRLHL